MHYVEVFRTNVSCAETAGKLVDELRFFYPEAFINFDLEDCDKILRIQAQEISISGIIRVLSQQGFVCEVL